MTCDLREWKKNRAVRYQTHHSSYDVIAGHVISILFKEQLAALSTKM